MSVLFIFLWVLWGFNAHFLDGRHSAIYSAIKCESRRWVPSEWTCSGIVVNCSILDREIVPLNTPPLEWNNRHRDDEDGDKSPGKLHQFNVWTLIEGKPPTNPPTRLASFPSPAYVSLYLRSRLCTMSIPTSMIWNPYWMPGRVIEGDPIDLRGRVTKT